MQCSLLAIYKLLARQILSLLALPKINLLLGNARKDNSIPLMLNGSDGYIRKYTGNTIGFFSLKGCLHYCLVPLENVRPEEKAKIQYYLLSDVVALD